MKCPRCFKDMVVAKRLGASRSYRDVPDPEAWRCGACEVYVVGTGPLLEGTSVFRHSTRTRGLCPSCALRTLDRITMSREDRTADVEQCSSCWLLVIDRWELDAAAAILADVGYRPPGDDPAAAS